MFELMLSNPSEKLKAFARGTLILDTTAAIGGGIALWAEIGDVEGFLAFLGTVIGGILVAWFTALLVEGFATIVARNEEGNCEAPVTGSAFSNIVVKDTPAVSTTSKAAGVNYDGSWNCSCGRKNSSYVSTCTCGKNKREITMEQANKQN